MSPKDKQRKDRKGGVMTEQDKASGPMEKTKKKKHSLGDLRWGGITGTPQNSNFKCQY